MANFQRARPRLRTYRRSKHFSSWPAYWDILHHRRPKRRARTGFWMRCALGQTRMGSRGLLGRIVRITTTGDSAWNRDSGLRFCKPKVGSSNLSVSTILNTASEYQKNLVQSPQPMAKRSCFIPRGDHHGTRSESRKPKSAARKSGKSTSMVPERQSQTGKRSTAGRQYCGVAASPGGMHLSPWLIQVMGGCRCLPQPGAAGKIP